MTMLHNRTFIATFALAATAVAAGCATQGPEAPLKPYAPAATSTARPIADFGASLRCMDNLLADFAVARVTLSVSEVADQSRSAAHRERLVEALSSMAVRSRAVRVVADAGRTDRSNDPRAYGLRGAVGPDEDQLSVVYAADHTVVPGAAARNAVIRLREGSGARTTSEIQKLGQRFGLPAGADESRALAQISAIEIVGKLAKVPYWSCIGATDRDEAVAAEIQDWFDGMMEQPAEIIAWFQNQMHARGVYAGPVNGTVNPEFKEAIARYREALGLSREAKFSLDFFQAYLSADHGEVNGRLRAVTAVADEPARDAAPGRDALPAQIPADQAASAARIPAAAVPVAHTTAAPVPVAQPHAAEAFSLHVDAANGARRFARGESVQFNVRPSQDAHVYCYLQDENRKISLVFPNRFRRDSLVPAGSALQLPGAMGFEISMNEKGGQQALLCLASPRDVLARLSPRVAGRDLEPLPAQSLEEVRRAYVAASGGDLARDQFDLAPR